MLEYIPARQLLRKYAQRCYTITPTCSSHRVAPEMSYSGQVILESILCTILLPLGGGHHWSRVCTVSWCGCVWDVHRRCVRVNEWGCSDGTYGLEMWCTSVCVICYTIQIRFRSEMNVGCGRFWYVKVCWKVFNVHNVDLRCACCLTMLP